MDGSHLYTVSKNSYDTLVLYGHLFVKKFLSICHLRIKTGLISNLKPDLAVQYLKVSGFDLLGAH